MGTRPRYYSIYANMLSRCRNPRNKSYAYYGGRGIKVCSRWLGKEGYRHFEEDMGEMPTQDKEANGQRRIWSIDRIDPDGDCTPENCKWSTRKEQAQNRRHKQNGAGNTGYMHITYRPESCKRHYRVHIIQDGESVFRQAFTTLDEAIEARNTILKDLAEKRGY